LGTDYRRQKMTIEEALKKQVALPPLIDKYKRVKCPNGHNIPVLYREKQFPFCPFCGQKIKWR
jgi:ribosomal protein S27E